MAGSNVTITNDNEFELPQNLTEAVKNVGHNNRLNALKKAVETRKIATELSNGNQQPSALPGDAINFTKPNIGNDLGKIEFKPKTQQPNSEKETNLVPKKGKNWEDNNEIDIKFAKEISTKEQNPDDIAGGNYTEVLTKYHEGRKPDTNKVKVEKKRNPIFNFFGTRKKIESNVPASELKKVGKNSVTGGANLESAIFGAK